MFSWRSLLKVLVSSDVPLNRNQALTLHFFAARDPSSSYLIKLALSKSALLLFQESPGAFDAESSDLIVFVVNGIVGVPSTPL